jgi:predicted permease
MTRTARMPWIGETWRDVRLAARMLRHSPGFACVAVLSLALGIGANTAIFQLIDAVRLRNLPVHNPGELAEVRLVGGNKGFGTTPSPYGELTRPLWQELRDHQQAFSGTFAWGTRGMFVGEGATFHPAAGLTVSGDFFRVLGVPAFRGRLIEPADEGGPCPTSRAVVSYAFWQRELGGRAIGGRDAPLLKIEDQPHEVIGVTPPTFLGLAVGDTFDVVVPFCQPKELRRELFDIAVMGRLRPGWTIDRASAHFGALSTGVFAATVPAGYSAASTERYKAFKLAAYPAASGVSWLRKQYDTSLTLLLAITGLVLLIACANLANLLLARASTREREVAVRLALGASRLRLLRQMLAESGLLAALGAIAGIGLAQVLSRLLVRSLGAEGDAPVLPIDLDWRALLFATLVGALTCIVFGVAPAIRATRTEPGIVMKAGGRGVVGGSGRVSIRGLSMQGAMVVTQIAVSLVLLVAALLFVRSFHNLMTFDIGMRQQGVLVGYFAYPRTGIPAERLSDFQRTLVDEVRAVPGIINAATTTNVPLVGGSWTLGVTVDAAEGSSKFTWVGPEYFQTMAMPVVQGRGLTLRDTQSSPRVVVVNQTFVKKFIGARSPLGRSVRTSPEPNYPTAVYEIVGVIPDTRYNSLRGETPPMAFAPDTQYPAFGPRTAMMVHTNLAPAAAIASVKAQFARTHPEMIVMFDVFDTRIRSGLVRERLLAMLSGFFGGLAALLAMVGLYGVMSYATAQRRHEIGIRVALGALRWHVVTMVMRDAAWLLAAGVVVGSALALLAGQSAASLLFGLQPHDPLTLAGACTLLAVIAGIASYLPARRASKLDPLVALRHD